MNAISANAVRPSPQKPSEMKSPLVASLILHTFLILLFSGAFFFFSKPVEFPEEQMAVEILNVSERAASPVDAPVAKPVKQPQEVKDEPPPMPKAAQAQPTPKQDAPKPVQKTEAPKIEEIKPKEAPKPPEKKAEVAEKKAAPTPSKVIEKKPPEQAKKVETKEKAKEDTEEFSSVLKNLVGADDAPPPQPDSVPRDTPRQAPQLTAPAPLGSELSMSEMDALRQQLAQCWSVLTGANEAENLAVDIEVNVTSAKTVQDARIVDQLRYGSDARFRAAADSAMRALRSPACTPLALPDGKYDQWKNMTVRFDPKDMF